MPISKNKPQTPHTPDLEVGRARAANQHIYAQDFETPGALVRWMGAMQAQDYHQAVWAVGARLKGATLAAVEAALAAGEIIRTWPMRGTIHFVPPEDAKWMLQLSASRMIAKDGRRLKQLEIDDDTLKLSRALFEDILKDGKPLSRPTLLQTMTDRGVHALGPRGYHLLWHSAQIGLICLGPMVNKEQTFVWFDAWVPRSNTLSREEGLATLAGRYFASHGPATLNDFAWWSGLTAGDAKAGVAAARPELHSAKVGNKTYWFAENYPPKAPSAANPAPDVALLAGFDEYLLGYQDRGAMLDPQHATEVCPGGNGIFRPMLVIDGQIVGTWKRAITKKAVQITCHPFGAMGEAETAAFQAAAQVYAAFVGLPAAFAR